MNSEIDTNDQHIERSPSRKSNPEGRQPLEIRAHMRQTIVRRTLDAIRIEDFRIPRDVDAHEQATPETALQLARPALYAIPTPPEIVTEVVSQIEQAQVDVEHDNVAFLEDARNRVMSSLPEQENYVPDHPRIDFSQDASYSEQQDSQAEYRLAA